MLIKKIYIMKGVGTAKSVLKIALLENGYTEIDLQTHFAYGDNYTFILKSGNFIHVEAMRSKGLKRKLPPFSLDGLSTGIAKDGKIIMWCAETPHIPYCLVELAQKYTTVKSENLIESVNRKSEISQSNISESKTTAESISSVSIDNTNQTNEDNGSSRNTQNEESDSFSKNLETAEFTDNNSLVDDEDNSSAVVVDSTETVEVVTPQTKDITQDFNILSIENEEIIEEPQEDYSEDDYAVSMAREIESKYSSYPHNETLENVFPDSKWILTENDDLSLGLLYNSEKITHICYAKKGEKDSSFDHNATYYEGWWVVINDNE